MSAKPKTMKRGIPTLVCATDFSPNASRAADVAAAIAARMGAELHLVHVADEIASHDEKSGELRALLRRVRERLRKEAGRLRASGAAVAEVVLHGSWAETAIVQYIAKQGARFAVVSAVSKTTFDRWTLGSVSERIAQQSPVPTLIVRDPERLAAWARGQRTLNVLVGVNFTESASHALAWVRELQEIGACSVTAAHVQWPPTEGGHAGVIGPRARRQLVAALQRKIADVVDGPVDIRVEGAWGRPDAALVQIAQDLAADLILVGTRQARGLKRLAQPSTSRGVMRHAATNVACVPTAGPVPLPGHLRRIRRALVATDFSAAGNRAVPWAFSGVVPGGAVKLVHVITPAQLSAPSGARDRKRTRTERRVIEEARRQLAALVPRDAEVENIAVEMEVIANREPARAISAAAQLFGADVICLGSPARTQLADTLRASVVRGVLAQASCPVMLVRPEQP